MHEENPAGGAITKLLTAFDLEPDHQRYFVRPVGREEAETNTACTACDLRASDAASYIPGCHVVIVTAGLVWDQKGQTHSTLNTHMENVDLLIGEEAQQDMDLKSAFACQLQSTYKDLSRVDLDLPEGLLVGLGYAATSPDSPLDFRQAQNAAERSGVASPHRWSSRLPTSARVAQEVYEPLIGIQCPMLCSRMGDTWQIGTTSIRADHLIASGLRFVHWCHASPNVHARHNPRNDPTVRVYQHLEDQLTKADTDDILALTTTREGATSLRNYFTIADKKAYAETAVKVAGATAKHCVVIHGVSTFLSGEGHNHDQECFTRANAYRATDLTCPLNMQGMPGALQVLALLHGVQTYIP